MGAQPTNHPDLGCRNWSHQKTTRRHVPTRTSYLMRVVQPQPEALNLSAVALAISVIPKKHLPDCILSIFAAIISIAKSTMHMTGDLDEIFNAVVVHHDFGRSNYFSLG